MTYIVFSGTLNPTHFTSGPSKGAQHCHHHHQHHHGAVTETSGDKFHAGRARVCLCEDVVMIEWRLIKARRAVMAFRFLYRRPVSDGRADSTLEVCDFIAPARPHPWTRLLHRGTHFDTRSMTFLQEPALLTLDMHYPCPQPVP